MLAAHFIGLAMGLGTGFSHAFLGAATAKMSANEATQFKLKTLAISMMGHIGIALLLISGLYLITPYWSVIGNYPWLIVKLSLVLILCVLIGILAVEGRKAKQGDAERHLKNMENIGKFTLIIGVAIVAIAVSVFH